MVLLVIIGTVTMLLTNSLLGGKYCLQQLLLSPQAAGHLPPEMTYLASDPSKLVRARKVAMGGAKDKDRENQKQIVGLGYDGRQGPKLAAPRHTPLICFTALYLTLTWIIFLYQ